MLSVRSYVRAHREAFLKSLRLWKKTPLTHGLTLITMMLHLMLLLMMIWLGLRVQTWLAVWHEDKSTMIYLKSSLTPSEQHAYDERLKASSLIQTTEFISPDAGLRWLAHQEGWHLSEDMGFKNPLPAVIVVTPVKSLTTLTAFDAWVRQLKSDPEVDQVMFDQWAFQQRDQITQYLRGFMWVFIVGLSGGVMVLSAHALRGVIQQAWTEIVLLHEMGATRAYVARPFVYLGLAYGLIGGVCALGAVEGLVAWASAVTQDTPWAPLWMNTVWQKYHVWVQCSFLLGSIICGLTGAWVWTFRRSTLIRN